VSTNKQRAKELGYYSVRSYICAQQTKKRAEEKRAAKILAAQKRLEAARAKK
jgi:hypothetical protein